MKDKRAVARSIELAERLLELPRPTKRLIMLSADLVALPTALWAALILKFDRLQLPLAHVTLLFTVAVVSGLLIFSLFGFYRTIIRFMAPKAMLVIVAGITLSVVAVATFDRTVGDYQVPLSAFVIYWAFALLYLTGSRFAVRYIFLLPRNGRAAARVAIFGAGDA